MSLLALNTASAANAGRVMPVLHPEDRTPLKNGDATMTLTLLGRDSDAFIRAENTARNRSVEQLSENVKFSAAAVDLEAAKTLAACTTGWTGIPKGWLDGSDDETPAKFSEEAALALYTSPGLKWVRDQADRFIGNRANFLTASPQR